MKKENKRIKREIMEIVPLIFDIKETPLIIRTEEQIDILFGDTYYAKLMKTYLKESDDKSWLDVIDILDCILNIKRKELELVNFDLKIKERR